MAHQALLTALPLFVVLCHVFCPVREGLAPAGPKTPKTHDLAVLEPAAMMRPLELTVEDASLDEVVKVEEAIFAGKPFEVACESRSSAQPRGADKGFSVLAEQVPVGVDVRVASFSLAAP